MAKPATVGVDLMAGLTVACVALPLNLALAIASGLPAGVGLVTGVVAGIVGALVGGARLQITGPEAALLPIVAEIVRVHGISGMIVAAFACGVGQTILGVARVGRFVAYIPQAVMRGFTAGIGLLLLLTQLPRLLGLGPEVTSARQLFAGLTWTSDAHLVGLGVGALMIVVMVALPRVNRRIPAALVGLALLTAAVSALSLDVPRIGAIPDRLPAIALPSIAGVDLLALLPSIGALTVVATMGSLLASSALERLTGNKADHDQELIAQGLANCTSACFGGMPVMGAIVRSTVAFDSGAKTRAAPIVHALALLAAMLFAASLVAVVPMAALAAILLVIGVRLLDLGGTLHAWRNEREKAWLLVFTALAICATDFLVGLGAGLGLALVLHLGKRLRDKTKLAIVLRTPSPAELQSVDKLQGGCRTHLVAVPRLDAAVVELDGPLVFLGRGQILETFGETPIPEQVVLDFRRVTVVDAGGVAALLDLLECLRARGTSLRAAGATGRVASELTRCGLLELLEGARMHPTVARALEELLSASSCAPERAHSRGPRRRGTKRRAATRSPSGRVAQGHG